MFEYAVYLFLFGIGLVVGSFLNVAVLRFGFAESRQSRSHCMACDVQISSMDLVPVFSYIVLQGRCRSCGSTLSLQYPLVELSTACVFLLAYTLVPPVWSIWSLVAFVSLLVFLASLVALTVYDLRHTLVPLPFVYALLLPALAASSALSISIGSWAPFLDSVSGGAVLALFFLALYVVTRGRGMGLGDAYVAGAIGLLLGLFRGIEAVMFAVWVGTVVYLFIAALSSLSRHTQLLRGMPRVTIRTELPFVPFLALGCLLALYTDLSPLAFGSWLVNTLWFNN